MVAQGHELANHGLVDTWPALQSPSEFEHHFHGTHDRLMEQVPDHVICWYRPGRGLYTPQMHQVILRASGYQPYFALASMLPIDTIAATAEPKFTAQYVEQHVFPGAILLLHGGSVERSKKHRRRPAIDFAQAAIAGVSHHDPQRPLANSRL